VSDTGQGIPPELLKKLFRPFVSSKPQGTGLGLSICRKIIEAHNGRISVSSQPEKGTTVTLSFPRRGDSMLRSKDGAQKNSYAESSGAGEGSDEKHLQAASKPAPREHKRAKRAHDKERRAG
jgi:hypothetical protein